MATVKANTTSKWGFWVKTIVSVIACLLLLWLVDWHEFGDTLKRANLYWLCVVFVIIHIDRVFMAYKWTILLRVLGLPVSLKTAAKAYYVGSFWSTFLPISVGGDVVRAGWLIKEVQSDARIISSVVVERLLGALALAIVALGSVILLIMSPSLGLPVFSKIIFLLLFGTIIAIIALFSQYTHSIAQKLLSRLPLQRVGRAIEKMRVAIFTFKEKPSLLIAFLILSILEESLPILAIFTLAKALSIDLSLLWVIIAVPIVLVVAGMPISVRGFGVIEGTYGLILSFAGIPLSAAVTMAVVDRVLVLLATLPGALWTISAAGSSASIPAVSQGVDPIEGG